jgi:hypothetical protein
VHHREVSLDTHLGGKIKTAVAAPRPAVEVGALGGRTIRTLLFLFAAVPVGAVALAVLIAGWRGFRGVTVWVRESGVSDR